MPDKAQPTVLPLPWSTKHYHSYYVQLVFCLVWAITSADFFIFFMKYAYNTSSLPIPHCVDKIISLYHVWGDQWQAKHIAEPTTCLVGTLRSLWGQQLVIWLVICKRYMKHSQVSRAWSVVYCWEFDGSFHRERCQKQDGLGAHQSCWKQADEIKKNVSICAHAARRKASKRRGASRTQSVGSNIKMGKVDRVCRWRRCSHKFDFGDCLTHDQLIGRAQQRPQSPGMEGHVLHLHWPIFLEDQHSGLRI